MEKEKEQEKPPKMSLLTKILCTTALAATTFTTCSCEPYTGGGYIEMYPRYYEYRTVDPFFSYPRYRPYIHPPTHRYIVPSPRITPPRRHPPTIRPSPPINRPSPPVIRPPTRPNIPHRKRR